MRSEARTSGLQDQGGMSGFVVSSRSTGGAGSSNSTSKSGISAASQSTFRPCASMISHEQHQLGRVLKLESDFAQELDGI